jgi:hypothetical protein
VPSTSRVPSLRLSLRRGDLAGLWIVVVTTVAASAAVASSAMGAGAPWLWGTGAGILVLIPGLFRTQWFELGIWVWNGCVRHIAAVLRRYVLAVGYYTILAALGTTKCSFDFAATQRRESMWMPRRPQTPPGEEERHHGLLSAATAPGRAWVIVLFPLVFLLDLLRDEQQDSIPPSSTYTLF